MMVAKRAGMLAATSQRSLRAARASSSARAPRRRAAAAAAGAGAGAALAAAAYRADAWAPVLDAVASTRALCDGAVRSFDDMDRGEKAKKSAALKTKQEHPTHSALDGGKVTVDLDDDDVAELEVMALADVEACRADVSRDGGGGQLLCTYEGIVYDVTQFAESHPGGKELLLTATGLDLKHFFDNYTVHGHSDKAARWLAPLAVGKLSPEDAALASARSTPEAHVDRRMARLGAARRRLLAVAAALPLAIGVRECVRAIGRYLSATVAKWVAARLPIAVAGFSPCFSPGSEPLPATEDGSARGVVAVVGGGIAGCSAAWMLARDGFEVHLYEARPATSGNARTFDWVDDTWTQSCVSNTGKDDTVKSCVSVTAWPPLLYKNYTALLAHLNVETVAMPLSWFLNSKVPGYEGTLWGADPRCDVANGVNTLRSVFANDFRKYAAVELFARRCTEFFTLAWAPWKRHDTMSMYTNHTGLGMLNPLNVVPLYSLFKGVGGSDEWWDIIFTPYYTASFLVDELRPFPAVFGPIIEAQIPLNPTPENSWHGASAKTDADCKLTTCVTWKDAGTGIRAVFAKLVEDVDVKVDTRVLECG
ncbi:hypothetical protein JL720_6588 [Aureococcus anophagefferens]|nr:hypothetical protein JL720_6588 [Aureococcus anophagefferens]